MLASPALPSFSLEMLSDFSASSPTGQLYRATAFGLRKRLRRRMSAHRAEHQAWGPEGRTTWNGGGVATRRPQRNVEPQK